MEQDRKELEELKEHDELKETEEEKINRLREQELREQNEYYYSVVL